MNLSGMLFIGFSALSNRYGGIVYGKISIFLSYFSPYDSITCFSL